LWQPSCPLCASLSPSDITIPVEKNLCIFYMHTNIYGTRFDKSRLPHTHNGKADFSQPLDFYINELKIHVCIIANGSLVCFSCGLFLRPVWCAQVLGGLQMAVVSLDKYSPGWKSPYHWPESLAIKIGYYLWYLELKWASGEKECT